MSKYIIVASIFDELIYVCVISCSFLSIYQHHQFYFFLSIVFNLGAKTLKPTFLRPTYDFCESLLMSNEREIGNTQCTFNTHR